MTEKLRPSLWRRLMNSLGAWPRGGVETFDLIPDGFVFTRRNKPVQVFWNEIVQIDAGMRDYLTVDLFFAVVHTDREKLVIDELADGFRLLEAGVFDRWPKIRERWLALQGGPHRWPALETLWKL